MRRAVVLSLLVLFSIAVIIPVMESSAHGERSRYHHKHHSKAWWRRYHARRRHMARMARLKARRTPRSESSSKDTQTAETAGFSSSGGALSDPHGFWKATLPSGWSSRSTGSDGEVKFRIYTQDGRPAGYSALAQVNLPPSPKPILASQARKFIGNFSFADLRRIVIDKMMNSNGWVINDYQRSLDGREVFVVVAQTAASSDGSVGPQPWSFFFAEVNGKVYSLATTAPSEFYDQANHGSEQLLSSIRSANPPSVIASVPR